MGRNKLDESDANERRKMQEVICHLVKIRKPNLSHSQYEDLLLIRNAAKDGGVYRKIARGKQLVSRLKLEQMIRECEKANVFKEQELLNEMQCYFVERDDAIIKIHLVNFYEQLDGASSLVLHGTVDLQNNFVKRIFESIKTVKGIK